MTVTIGDIEKWNLDILDTVFEIGVERANHKAAFGSMLTETQRGLADWQGESGTAFHEELTKNYVDITAQGAEPAGVVAAVLRARSEIAECKDELSSIEQIAYGKGWSISPDGWLTGDVDDEDLPTFFNLRDRLDVLMPRADAADRDLATAFRAVVGDVKLDAHGHEIPGQQEPKQVPGPHPGDPQYATGLRPTLSGDPHDVPPMKVDPGSSATVQLTDNPPGYTGPAGQQRDAAWLAYLSQQNGATPGVVSPNMVLPNPEAVSNPGLKTVGAAARQQGISYAWGAGHPGPPDTTTPAPPGVSQGNLNGDLDGKAAFWGDGQRTGFDCSGLSRFATSEGHPGLDISKGTWGDTISQYQTLTTEGGAGTKIYNGADLMPGDVLYFGPEGASHHVAIYAGNGLMIQAAESGVPVEVSPISTEGHVGVHINR